MRIVRYRTCAPDDARGMVVALGNFDGVHRGHQAVFSAAREIAAERGLPFGVVTFEPHPRSVLRPDPTPFRLTPLRSKARAIATCGADALIVLRFDRALSRKTANDFVTEVLIDGLAVAHLVVGHDFGFGKDRRGDARLLGAMAEGGGFGFTQVAAARASGEPFASTAVRQALRAGDVVAAARILGRWWEVEDRVESGERIGHEIGYPTVNLAIANTLHPARGIYAVWAGLGEGDALVWHPGAANFGTRPTFGGERELLEVHLLDFAGDLYAKRLRVRFVARLRPEEKFDDVAALVAQIARDCEETRSILAARGPDGPPEGGP